VLLLVRDPLSLPPAHPRTPFLPNQVDELKKRSEDTKRALEVQRRQEEEQQRRLRELQEVQQSQQQQFVSLQEQAAYYGAQIKSQYELYKARQQEQQDLRVGFDTALGTAGWHAELLAAACAALWCIHDSSCTLQCHCRVHYGRLLLAVVP
jgi:hypothetical protein